MPENTNHSLKDLLDQGWSIVTYPMQSPVCELSESMFAESIIHKDTLENTITNLNDVPVEVILVRDGIYQKLQIAAAILVKMNKLFGRRNGIITDGQFSGWIVAGNKSSRAFLLARPTENHSDEFESIRGHYHFNVDDTIPRIECKADWLLECDRYLG